MFAKTFANRVRRRLETSPVEADLRLAVSATATPGPIAGGRRAALRRGRGMRREQLQRRVGRSRRKRHHRGRFEGFAVEEFRG